MNRDVKIAGLGLAAGVASTVLVLFVVAVLFAGGDTAPLTATPVRTPQVPPPPTIVAATPTSDEEVGAEVEKTDEDADGADADDDFDDEYEDEYEDDEYDPADAPLLPNAAPAGQGSLPDATPVTCPSATARVDSAAGLDQALEAASAGDVIELSPGRYVGQFVATASGTPREPIYLCGPAEAVLDGGDLEDGYVLHLDRATHWRLVGFSVVNGQKGVMADGTVGTVIQGLTVEHIGDEAIHLRTNSTDNLVRGNTIGDTGLRRDDYGEGVYVGTAVSNWCTYNDCQPDRSDRNVIADNTITATTAEAIDIKEATTGGLVTGNTFDGSHLTDGDSWVDVKGNNWLIEKNTGTHSPMDGFQTHQILDGWGDHNVFRDNTARVNGPGLGFAIWPEESNVVTCDNDVVAAGEGFSNLSCS